MSLSGRFFTPGVCSGLVVIAGSLQMAAIIPGVMAENVLQAADIQLPFAVIAGTPPSRNSSKRKGSFAG